MKKLKLVVCMAIALLSVMPLSAQTKIKLGHIDRQALLAVMPEMTDAEKKMNDKQEEVRKDIMTMYESYQKLMAEFQDNQATYTEMVRTAKAQEIQDMENRINQFQQLAQQQLTTLEQELTQPIVDKMNSAIESVGKEKGYTYIFEKAAVVYAAANSEDVMPYVKAKLGLQ